jgi:acryloyl-coenzyme A reductase
MRAIVMRQNGGADQLQLEIVPTPEPRPGWVRVKVHAEGVCYRDVIERRGGFAFMKRPVVPGHEFAGVIDACGDDVVAFAPGDRVVNLHRAACGSCPACLAGHETRCRRALEVFGLSVDGGYAEYVVAPVGALVRLPEAIPFEQACFLNCTAGVALHALRGAARLQAGERVLVTGASGGVGIHALQVAKILGAHVIAATTSADKAELLGAYGADEVIVGDPAQLHHAVKRASGGTGVEVALDCVGTPTLNAALRSLAPGGRLVVVGNVTTERWEINPGFLILAALEVHGSAGCNRAELEQVLQWVAQGRLRPVLQEVLPLAEAASAQQRLEDKRVGGRLVLSPLR